MDVDGGAVNPDQQPQQQQHEVEQSLLQEFSRMGTRDREDLITQMQKLLGPDLSYNSATFFLDMNNWNLQDAVCSYLDFVPTIMMPPDFQRPVSSIALPMPMPTSGSPASSLQMNQVSPKDVLAGPYPPATNVEWVWAVKNPGASDWPEGCVVVPSDSREPIAQLPVVKAKDVYFIKYNLTTPSSIGVHSQAYRLCTPQGDPFGDELCARLRVQCLSNGVQCDMNGTQVMDQVLDENM